MRYYFVYDNEASRYTMSIEIPSNIEIIAVSVLRILRDLSDNLMNEILVVFNLPGSLMFEI